MFNDCICGSTGGCPLCNPALTNVQYQEQYIDLSGCIIIPKDSRHRKYVENDLEHWNIKMGLSKDFGFYTVK